MCVSIECQPDPNHQSFSSPKSKSPNHQDERSELLGGPLKRGTAVDNGCQRVGLSPPMLDAFSRRSNHTCPPAHGSVGRPLALGLPCIDLAPTGWTIDARPARSQRAVGLNDLLQRPANKMPERAQSVYIHPTPTPKQARRQAMARRRLTLLLIVALVCGVTATPNAFVRPPTRTPRRRQQQQQQQYQ